MSWARFGRLGELTVYDRTADNQIISRIGDADVVYTNKTPISRKTLEACPAIRYIGVLATGYNVVDVAAAKEKGIPVTNIPNYGTNAVAQYVFALLLELCHHVGAHSQAVMSGEWGAQPDFCFWHYPLVELAGKTMGIIGFGRIGRAAAKIAVAFGMKVLVSSAHEDPSLETPEIRYAPLEEVLRSADVISLHCPLFEATREMINKDTIALMKESTFIINTARGGLVRDADMALALGDGKIAGYAADVASTEPIGGDNPLLGAKNVILTPHIAWASKESRQRLMDIAADNLEKFAGGEPVNVVNR